MRSSSAQRRNPASTTPGTSGTATTPSRRWARHSASSPRASPPTAFNSPTSARACSGASSTPSMPRCAASTSLRPRCANPERAQDGTEINARDFQRARKDRETRAHLPNGTLVAIAGGRDVTDPGAVFDRLDRVRARHADMVLVHDSGPDVDRSRRSGPSATASTRSSASQTGTATDGPCRSASAARSFFPSPSGAAARVASHRHPALPAVLRRTLAPAGDGFAAAAHRHPHRRARSCRQPCRPQCGCC